MSRGQEAWEVSDFGVTLNPNWSGREHRVLFAGVGNVAPGMGISDRPKWV